MGKFVTVEALFGVAANGAKIEVGDSSHQIDKNYRFNPVVLRKAILWLKGAPGFTNLGLVGNAGTGKTSFLKELAARMGREYRSVSVSGDTRFESLFGRREIKDGNTVYVETGLGQMVRAGGIFCANEFFRMDPGEAMRLVELLDIGGEVTNPETGDVIPRHPDFRFCFTGNSGGFGDESGAYAGEKRGSFALRDRCTILMLPEMSEEEEIAMVMANTPQLKEYEEVVTNMVKTAKAVRAAFVGRNGGVALDISPRGLVRWSGQFYAYWSLNNGASGKIIDDPLIESLMDSCLNGAPEEDVHAVLELAKTWLNE